MAGQQGFAYESRVHNRLNAGGFVPRGFTPAGSNPSAPDCAFVYGGRSHNLEFKLDLKTDYGQGTLNYSGGSWSLGGANTAAADEMRRLLRSVGTEQFANQRWGIHGAPNKGTVMPEQFTQAMVNEDYRKFRDNYLTIPSSALHSYYAAKGTYYIQVGGYGLHRGYFAKIFPETSALPLYFIPSLFLVGNIFLLLLGFGIPLVWTIWVTLIVIYRGVEFLTES